MHRIAALGLFLLASCASATAPPIWSGLPAGTHRVGYRTEKLNSPPHQLAVSVWYPASGGGNALTLSDLTETPDYAQMLTGNGVPEASAQKLLAQPLAARADAKPDGGRYPLVLIVQGNGQWGLHQAILSEYLASHGFAVVTIPSITRLEGPIKSDGDVVGAIAAQTDDLQRAFAFAANLPNIDRSRLFVLGHSLGARAALLFATRQPVAGIISLDGGIGTATGSTGIPRVASLPPILHIYEERDAARLQTDLTFLRSLPTRNLRLEKLENIGHIHFTTIGFAAASDPAIAKVTEAGVGVRSDVLRIGQLVLEFLH